MLAGAGIVLIAAALVLGTLTASRPPNALDVAAERLRGQNVPLALAMTRLGRWYGVVGVIYAASAVAVIARAPLLPVIMLSIAQALSQATSALIKLGFHRIRPGPIIAYHEPDFSYPSGHTVTALVLFAGCALLSWYAPLPRPVSLTLVVVLVTCAVGIPWSRLALGAHYATDVAGGLLLGAGWLCIALAAIGRWGLSLSR